MKLLTLLSVASLIAAYGLALFAGYDALTTNGLGFIISYAAGLVMITGLLVMLPASVYAIVKNRWMPRLEETTWFVWGLIVLLTALASWLHDGAG